MSEELGVGVIDTETFFTSGYDDKGYRYIAEAHSKTEDGRRFWNWQVREGADGLTIRIYHPNLTWCPVPKNWILV